jgi:hypothetical protein
MMVVVVVVVMMMHVLVCPSLCRSEDLRRPDPLDAVWQAADTSDTAAQGTPPAQQAAGAAPQGTLAPAQNEKAQEGDGAPPLAAADTAS